MTNENITFDIWGRSFDLEVIYDCFEGEEITSIQKETFDEFKNNSETIFKDAYLLLKE